MNPLLKHITVRLWLTAMMGGAISLIAMPWWQRIFGLNWLVLPVLVVLLLCFGVLGWALNRVGTSMVGRYIKEASIWERAGMIKEAEGALQRAAALFDGFWLSPLFRQQRSRAVMGTLARFYLGQTARNTHAREMVATYLCQNPDDDSVAEGWLEQLLNREHHTAQEYEAAARIGERLDGHGRIQQLLMQFHLTNGRSDFDALQTYQKVWQHHAPPPDLVHELARLLLNDGVLSHWALKVYLTDFHAGHQDALDGIAAAVHWLRPTVENRQDLEAAKQAVGEMAKGRIGRLASRFKPEAQAVSEGARTRIRKNDAAQRTKVMAKGIVVSGNAWLLKATSRCIETGRRVRRLPFSQSAIVSGGIISAMVVLIVFGLQVREDVDVATSTVPVEQVTPVIEPFTIQVAAYVKTEDAQKFVDRLNQSGLEAFWTKATSADRTWYQVKVSHFETKEQAMHYGQELKTKGLIDDFYVANYQKPQRQTP